VNRPLPLAAPLLPDGCAVYTAAVFIAVPPRPRSTTMSQEAKPDSNAVTERVCISCPGCGRHDFVHWPPNQDTYHWKCFNCRKEFDLHRGRAH
jgi:hypothetical protein